MEERKINNVNSPSYTIRCRVKVTDKVRPARQVNDGRPI